RVTRDAYRAPTRDANQGLTTTWNRPGRPPRPPAEEKIDVAVTRSEASRVTLAPLASSGTSRSSPGGVGGRGGKSGRQDAEHMARMTALAAAAREELRRGKGPKPAARCRLTVDTIPCGVEIVYRMAGGKRLPFLAAEPWKMHRCEGWSRWNELRKAKLKEGGRRCS